MSIDALLGKVAESLKRQGHKLAVAESCTGGALAAALTSKPGSSTWFERGFVVYSNASKTEMLGVSEESAVRHGSVSDGVVREMAAGALERSHASISVAVTGVAGPGGGTAEKPVGTVWLAWSVCDGETCSRKMLFEGDRAQIREQSIEAALNGILTLLE